MSIVFPHYKTYDFLEKKYQEYLIEWIKKTKIQNAYMIRSIPNSLIIQNINTIEWDYKILSTILPPSFIFKNINKPWNWDAMGINPLLTWNDYIQHKDKPWNLQKLTSNINIDVYKLIECDTVYWSIISHRKDIPLDILEKYISDKHRWSWMCLSLNSSIPISFILKFPTASWDWKLVTCRAQPEEIIYYKSIPWDYASLSMHTNQTRFPFKYIYENPDRPWDYSNLSQRDDVDIEMVIEYPERNWNWSCLSKYVHFDQIVKYPDLNWQKKMLYQNKTLTKEHVHSTPQFDWDLKQLKRLVPIPYITVENKPTNWDTEYVLCNWGNNPNIIELIEAYPEKNWYWYRISYSSHLTLQCIEKYKDKPWDWGVISKRRFKYSKQKWIHNYRLRHIAALRLQRHIRHHFWNPNFQCGQRVLARQLEK